MSRSVGRLKALRIDWGSIQTPFRKSGRSHSTSQRISLAPPLNIVPNHKYARSIQLKKQKDLSHYLAELQNGVFLARLPLHHENPPPEEAWKARGSKGHIKFHSIHRRHTNSSQINLPICSIVQSFGVSPLHLDIWFVSGVGTPNHPTCHWNLMIFSTCGHLQKDLQFNVKSRAIEISDAVQIKERSLAIMECILLLAVPGYSAGSPSQHFS